MTTITPSKPQAARARDIQAARWRIDPTRSRIAFQSHTLWGLVSVEGRFDRYEGTLDFRREAAIELTIGASSIDTNNRRRDKHLRSAEFFDTAQHPEVRFTSDSATLKGERLKVRGRLSAAGESMPLDLDATLRRVGDELEVAATALADHRELGMTDGLLGMIDSATKLIVQGRLVRDSD